MPERYKVKKVKTITWHDAPESQAATEHLYSVYDNQKGEYITGIITKENATTAKKALDEAAGGKHD